MTRKPARLRTGAEEGVAQVLTPAETLELLDRLAAAEAVERAAVEYQRVFFNGPGAEIAMYDLFAVLDTRRSDLSSA